MYFGSVKFFKHLIYTVIIGWFAAATFLAVFFGIRFGLEAKKNKELAAAAEAVTDVSSEDEDLTLEQYYLRMAADGYTTEDILNFIKENDSAAFDGCAEEYIAGNPDKFDVTADSAGSGSGSTAAEYTLLYPDLYAEAPTEFTEKEKTIYLTFDDGPSENTVDILNILDKYDIKATFFMCGGDSCAMVLGDNIFYGNGFSHTLRSAARAAEQGKATVFGYYVNDPERFGIVEFDEEGKVLSVEEKPQHPKSNYAITGLYFYPAGVAAKAKQVKFSQRGELEITSLNEMYLQEERLNVELLGRGYAWLDTGTMDSLVDAADFVRTIETRQGSQIAALEEIAFNEGWIDKETLLQSAQRYGKSPYGQHLMHVADGKIRY